MRPHKAQLRMTYKVSPSVPPPRVANAENGAGRDTCPAGSAYLKQSFDWVPGENLPRAVPALQERITSKSSAKSDHPHVASSLSTRSMRGSPLTASPAPRPMRCRLRREKAVPGLTALGQWLAEQRAHLLPKSPMGQAV